MNKKNKKQHSDEYYQQIVERNIDHMLDHPHVHSFGLGYRQIGDEFTDEVCLVVEIYKKKSRVAAKWKIPDFIDGIPTDIIELAEPDRHDKDDPEALLDLQTEHHEAIPMQSIPCLPPCPPPPPGPGKPQHPVQEAPQPLPGISDRVSESHSRGLRHQGHLTDCPKRLQNWRSNSLRFFVSIVCRIWEKLHREPRDSQVGSNQEYRIQSAHGRNPD